VELSVFQRNGGLRGNDLIAARRSVEGLLIRLFRWYRIATDLPRWSSGALHRLRFFRAIGVSAPPIVQRR
jgi:hypothetical protein